MFQYNSSANQSQSSKIILKHHHLLSEIFQICRNVLEGQTEIRTIC